MADKLDYFQYRNNGDSFVEKAGVGALSPKAHEYPPKYDNSPDSSKARIDCD